MKKRILALILCIVMCMGTVALFSSCGGDSDAFVIMSEELDGLFNPFYATTGPDNTIVSMTQIGMVTSKYVNGKVEVAYGDNEAVVTKDYQSKYDATAGTDGKGQTTFTYVLKNGIKFSDGKPLTMKDVLFNLYVYLDPVYTGSSTMYSTAIVGLNEYRTQTKGGTSGDEQITNQATGLAKNRINELKNLFNTFETKPGSGTYKADYETMKAAILKHNLSKLYMQAVSGENITNEQLLKDYDYTLKLFREELERDYVTAQSSYTEEPYKSHEEFKDEITCFMTLEGYVEITWGADKNGVPNKDKSKIESIKLGYNPDTIKTKEDAINHVYNDIVSTKLNQILEYWATATTLLTEYTAEAKEVILHNKAGADGKLNVESISGIVSLGHHTDVKEVEVNGKKYKVAREFNADGTPKNADEYEVLQITISGKDPKAQWNFAFSVAPQHYYGEGSSVGINLAKHQYGVEFGKYSFMTKIVQSPRNIKVPVGAGAYKATDRENNDNPAGDAFYSDKVVYFKANDQFYTVGSGLHNAKIEKIRYQVIPANDAIQMLEKGSVHYITPQLTTENYKKLKDMDGNGYSYILEDQLGYGYIGINASEIPNINIRKAIMSAMNTTLALNYYSAGTASQIYYPMSTVSWAHPVDDKGNPLTKNGAGYPQVNNKFIESVAINKIKEYMKAAGVSEGDPSLEITFTIAGSNLQDHPTYETFRDAAALLNSLGWQVTVVPDTQALTKLATGSLAVWAAAWGSTIDPDMYQVYHKNSSATSTLAWGYPSIKTSGSAEEKKILNELSKLIDDARKVLNEEERAPIYKQAMEKVLELAIELPVYQRSVVYAYNSDVINSSSLPEARNPYSSPLDRIWEIEFVNAE
ncbi:MAG: hypothetical protein J6K52_00345 [Clostridia bacterium]|nr:hypothetical protein [Clostridia bacterium]MBO5092045.1 hypothetical protein [Clostridia bacterium]MBP3494639.1 hypothetical protein [Clostridia bacterium]